MMTLISCVNSIYGLVSCNQHFQLLLLKAPRNAWKYFKVIRKSQGILFCLTCGNAVNAFLCVCVCIRIRIPMSLSRPTGKDTPPRSTSYWLRRKERSIRSQMTRQFIQFSLRFLGDTKYSPSLARTVLSFWSGIKSSLLVATSVFIRTLGSISGLHVSSPNKFPSIFLGTQSHPRCAQRWAVLDTNY